MGTTVGGGWSVAGSSAGSSQMEQMGTDCAAFPQPVRRSSPVEYTPEPRLTKPRTLS